LRANILSLLYKISRYIITNFIYLFQKLFSLPKDLEPAVKIGDSIISSTMLFKKVIYEFPLPENYRVEVYDLVFPSPIIGASFKSDDNVLDMWLRMGIGGVILKTIMKDKRVGNPVPRLQDTRYGGVNGLINSLGLPGAGLNQFLISVKNQTHWSYKRPIGISVGGENESDYVEIIKKIENVIKTLHDQYFYELNISCPNTKNGQTICENPFELDTLLENLRRITKKTLSVKVSPDISNKILNDIGIICSNYDRIIINAGNTQYKSREQVGLNQRDFSMSGGGLSGPSIFPRTLEMIEKLSKYESHLMATGGISDIKQVNELKKAGATLFGIATSLVLDPYCIPKINRYL